MEAVVFDGKSLTLKYDPDYPMPQLVNDDDVIVKVEYSGVCGTDLHIIQVTNIKGKQATSRQQAVRQSSDVQLGATELKKKHVVT